MFDVVERRYQHEVPQNIVLQSPSLALAERAQVLADQIADTPPVTALLIGLSTLITLPCPFTLGLDACRGRNS